MPAEPAGISSPPRARRSATRTTSTPSAASAAAIRRWKVCVGSGCDRQTRAIMRRSTGPFGVHPGARARRTGRRGADDIPSATMERPSEPRADRSLRPLLAWLRPHRVAVVLAIASGCVASAFEVASLGLFAVLVNVRDAGLPTDLGPLSRVLPLLKGL